MKIVLRLLACFGAFMVVKGLPRDLELVTRILPQSAANPYLSGRAIGELTASLMILVLTIGLARMTMRKRPNLATAPRFQATPGAGAAPLPLTWAEERALAGSSTGRPERSGMKLVCRLASWYLCAYGLYGLLRDVNTLSLGMSGGSRAVSEPLPETLGKLTVSVLTIGGAILFARLGSQKTSARPGIAGR